MMQMRPVVTITAKMTHTRLCRLQRRSGSIDSNLWNLTPRLRYGQASSFINMEYSSGPLEDMENRPHSASSIPREGSPDSRTICSVPSTTASPGEGIAETPSNPQSKDHRDKDKEADHRDKDKEGDHGDKDEEEESQRRGKARGIT
ncbi:PREDICTED: uncharacterized protein LOC104701925 [Camelina sativa]|uniref:Uncharacterized protein LOC104701925 n=1 Tax=Camelina sativa TaxID=90675 RepID=A0ABM0STQ7_CAMSA|nr:PREDICTED: uncharacterized protein LOC104701925 [Camelina sativa]